jgi:hypothetical protein
MLTSVKMVTSVVPTQPVSTSVLDTIVFAIVDIKRIMENVCLSATRISVKRLMRAQRTQIAPTNAKDTNVSAGKGTP